MKLLNSTSAPQWQWSKHCSIHYSPFFLGHLVYNSHNCSFSATICVVLPSYSFSISSLCSLRFSFHEMSLFSSSNTSILFLSPLFSVSLVIVPAIAKRQQNVALQIPILILSNIVTFYLFLATCYLLPVTCYMLLIISWYLQSDSFRMIIGFLKPAISCNRIVSFCSCSATRSCSFIFSLFLFGRNYLPD